MSAEEKSHPFYVYSGLISPEHINRIGPAWGVFLWCLNKTTFEEFGVGHVCSGEEVNADDIRENVGGSRDSIYRHLKRLEMYGYINAERGSKGFYITVLKSKRWKKNGESDHAKVPDQTLDEPESDYAKLRNQEPDATGSDSAELPNQNESDYAELQDHNPGDYADLQDHFESDSAKVRNHACNRTRVKPQEKQLQSKSLSEERNLSLDEDAPTNRWLRRYQLHRPGAGHPLAKLSASDIEDTRLRVESLVDEFGEERATELLADVFAGKRRPVSVNQAVLYCQQLDEELKKAQKSGRVTVEKSPTDPSPPTPAVFAIADLPPDLAAKCAAGISAGQPVVSVFDAGLVDRVRELVPDDILVEAF